jgi:hypothetical protein
MNMPLVTDAHRWPGPVLRTADRMRLEGCVNALTLEGLSLSLQCNHEALLDHYCRLLLTRLRGNSEDHLVEVYFPANTTSLLDRFNAILADQSVVDATRMARSIFKTRIWVVHDAQKVPQAELQLLARLIQNFPGARVRALLLFHGSDVPAEALVAFGRKILRWDIELPTPEQAREALDAAQMEGQHAQLSRLLRRIDCLPNATPMTALSLGMEAAQHSAEDLHRLKMAEPALESVQSRRMPRWMQWLTPMIQGTVALKKFKMASSMHHQTGTKKLALGAGLALMLTLAIVAWVQPTALPDKKTLTEKNLHELAYIASQRPA